MKALVYLGQRKMELNAFEPGELEKKHYTSVVLAVNVPEPAQKYLSSVKSGGRQLLFAGYQKGSVLEIDPYHVHYMVKP